MEKSKTYLCPLCQSPLSRERWVKITGQWKDREKILEQKKKEIEKIKQEKFEAEKKYKLQAKKLAKEAEIIGIKKGIAKEKSQTERMTKMIAKQTKDLQESQKKIKLLEKQLQEGTTPQIEGFDYEKEVFKLLSENFPEDEIKSTGKKGDNIQFVKFGEKEIGSILYECKKTSSFSNAFILEVKKHQEAAMANYAVLVTHASKKGKSKFFVENGVIVVDPLGLLDVAFLLRETIIEMHQLKLTKEKMNQKSEAILKYMQSGEFKSRMINTIEKAEEAYINMAEEMKHHKKDWEKRFEIYSSIHGNVQSVRAQIGVIITGDESLLDQIKALPRLDVADQ